MGNHWIKSNVTHIVYIWVSFLNLWQDSPHPELCVSDDEESKYFTAIAHRLSYDYKTDAIIVKIEDGVSKFTYRVRADGKVEYLDSMVYPDWMYEFDLQTT